MEFLTKIGTVAACCGGLFFLFCAALVFWYLFNQTEEGRPRRCAGRVSPRG